jgi:protein SCO1/2
MNIMWLFTLLLLLAGSGCSEQAFTHRHDVSPSAGPPNRTALIRSEHLPNVELTTHEGLAVRFYEDLVKGQIVAINFMFTTCGNTCPLITEYLAAAQKALGERMSNKITLLSISLEPEHDTPEMLRRYRQSRGVGQGWIFLTGRRDDIEFLRRRLGVYDLDPGIDTDPSQHAGIVILGNEPQGRWKAISALSHPIRIRQAMERTILPPSQWPTGETVVNEVPSQDNEAVETADLSILPPAN